jgi:hypothetical protein
VNFLGRYTFLENMGSTHHICKARLNHLVQQALQVRPALPGAADPPPWHDYGPDHRHSLEHNLDKRDSLKKRWFDQRVEARITWINGSTYPVAQPPQPSSRGDSRRSLQRSVHHMAQGRAGHTYQLACWAKPTQGADLQPP